MLTLTTDNWFAICGIAIALCAPVAQVLFQRYLERRDLRLANTVGSPDSTQSVRRLRIARILTAVLPSAVLGFEAMSPYPLNRLSVLAISISVASLASLLMLGVVASFISRLVAVQQSMAELQEKQFSVTARFIERATTSADSNASGPAENSTSPAVAPHETRGV